MNPTKFISLLGTLLLVPFSALVAEDGLPAWMATPFWAEPIPDAIDPVPGFAVTIPEPVAPYAVAAPDPLAVYAVAAPVSVDYMVATPRWILESNKLIGRFQAAGVSYVPHPRITTPAGVMFREAGDDQAAIDAAWKFYGDSRARELLYPSPEN